MTLNPGPAPRRGRRDNGLDATAFAPLRDVDPRVGEHLLDLLREAGIAAYLEPTSDVDNYTRAVSLPSPPTDRLFVDRAARPDATALVAEHADGDRDPQASRSWHGVELPHNEQAAWEAIVANYDRQLDTPLPPWPVPEDAPTGAEATAGAEPGTESKDAPATSKPATPARRPPTRRERAAERRRNPDDHYQPPPPPPVPALSRYTLYALVLVAVGVTLFIAPGLLGFAVDAGFVLGVLAIAGGMGMLVYRMRERPPFDDGPDDGAVV